MKKKFLLTLIASFLLSGCNVSVSLSKLSSSSNSLGSESSGTPSLTSSGIGSSLEPSSNPQSETDGNGTSEYSTNLGSNESTQLFIIRFVTNGGTLPSGYQEENEVEATSSYHLPIPEKEGYTFVGWFLGEGDDAKQFPDYSPIDSDLVLYAVYAEIQYKISYDLKGGVNDEANPSGYSITSETITLLEPTKDGAIFLGWTFSEQKAPLKKVQIEKGSLGDLSFTAHWYESKQIKNDANVEEPADEEEPCNRYCVLEFQDDDVFVLAYFTIYESGFVHAEAECGIYKNESDGIIRLIFSDPERKDEFVVADGNRYIFVDESGTPISELGNEDIEINFDNVVEPYIPGEEGYGYHSFNLRPDAKKLETTYNLIWKACSDFSKSFEDLDRLDLVRIPLAELDVSFLEFVSVFKLFMLDHPRYYFLSQTISGSDYDVTLEVSRDYVSGSYREKIEADIDIMINDCAKVLTKGQDDLSRYLAIHDYVISLIDYAYEEDGTPSAEPWAHSIVGSAEKKGGVCECYAETFDLLCRHYGLEDIQTPGVVVSNGEAHVWNNIKLDGLYYSVDVTWDDMGEDKAAHEFFGIGYAATRNYKTMDESSIDGIDYLYKLPRMSNESLELVYLNRGEANLGTYKNLDDALANIKDEEFEYSIELFPYSMASGPLLLSGPSVNFSTKMKDWPAAKKINIVGAHYDLGDGYFTDSLLYLKDDITFHSDVEFASIRVYNYDESSTLCFDGYSLTTSGYFCGLAIPIASPDGTLISKADYETDLLRTVELGSLRISGTIQIYDKTHIGEVIHSGESGGLCLYPAQSATKVKIDRLEALGYFCSTMIYALDPAYFDLEIGDIVAPVESTVRFTYVFDLDDHIGSFHINGELSAGANIDIVFYGYVVTLWTDLGGNELGKEERNATVNSGTVVLVAPNIDGASVGFQFDAGESKDIVRGEGGVYTVA